MSDGWCEKCWERASLTDAKGRYTYRCEVCGPDPAAAAAAAPVVPVNDKGRPFWMPNRAERRKLKSEQRKAARR